MLTPARYPRARCVLAAVAVAAVLIATSACERRRGPAATAPADTATGPVPTSVSFDARFKLVDDGKPRSVLRAERMERYDTDDSTYTLLRSPSDSMRVRVYVFDEEGDSSATIVADRVYLYPREDRFEAYDNVIVNSRDDKTLRSEHLTWNAIDRKIRTQRFVRIVTPTESVQGTGLVADEDLDTYSIGRFTARVEVDDEGPSPPDTASAPSPDAPPPGGPRSGNTGATGSPNRSAGPPVDTLGTENR